MLKVIVLLVFTYNLVTTISDPTIQDWVINGTLLLLGLGLVAKVGKKTIGIAIRVIAIVVLVAYVLIHFEIITLT